MPTGMGNPKKRATTGGPTRRTVLVTALAAGAGVASTRMLGLRNLNGPAAVEAIDDMAASGMDAMGIYGAAEPDAMSLIPDDSFFGSQDLDASVLPEPPRPLPTLPTVAASRSVTGQLLPPISGITAPRLAGDLDWVSPLG